MGYLLENKMYQLSLKEVKEKAMEYYNKGLLTAQHPDPTQRLCINKLGDCRCAVAACYPDEILGGPQGTVEAMVRDGLVKPPEDRLEWAAIVRIQQAHDFWANFAKDYPTEKDKIERFRSTFLSMIQPEKGFYFPF